MKRLYHRHPDLLLASLLFFLSFLPLIICLATGRTLVLDGEENLAEWWPYRIFVNQALKERFLPLWCPGLLAGFPFLAWSHSSALSPAGVIYFLLPFDKAAVMSLTLHLLIYNLGLYYLLRGLKIRPFPALLAVIQTGFGFFLLIEQRHFLPNLLTLSLVPLGYALLYRLLLLPRIRYLLGFMAICLFEVLGGQLEFFGRIMVLAVLVIMLYGLFLRPVPRLALSRLALFTGAVTGVTLLILVQILPTFELIAFSTRSTKLPLDFFMQQSIKVNKDFLHFLFFNPLILASVLFAFVLVRKDLQVLLLLVIFALCFAVSTNTLGCLRLVHLIPVLNRFHWHGYTMVIGIVFLAVLAGKAMDHLISEASSAQGFLFLLLALALSWAASKDVFLALNGLAVAIISIMAAFHYFAQRKQRRIGASLNSVILALTTGAFYLSCLTQLRLGGAEFMKHDPIYVKSVQSLPVGLRSLNLTNPNYHHSLSIPYQAGIYYHTQSFDFFMSVIPRWTYDFLNLIKPFWRLEDFRLHRSMPGFDMFKRGHFIQFENLKFLNLLNLGLIATDHENLKFSQDYHPIYYTGKNDCSPAPCLIRDAATSPYRRPNLVLPANGAWRHTIFVKKGDRLQFQIGREKGTAAMIFTLLARRPPDPKEFLIFQKEIPADERRFQKHSLDLSIWAGQTLELQFGVRASQPEGKVSSSGLWLDPAVYHQEFVFEKLAESGDVSLYRNRQVLPRAFLLHQIRIIPEREARLKFMASGEFDPARMAVLEKPPIILPSPPPPGAGEGVQISDYQPNRVSILSRVSAPAILFISDTYFPGWRAFDRGQEITLLRVNHAFRGLALSPGTHYVEMVYQPRSFRLGLWTSLATSLAMIVISKPWKILRSKNRKPSR